MKRMLTLVLALALLVSNATFAVQPPKGFDGEIWKSTLALYGTKDGSTKFLCTAEVIEKTHSGYHLLSAGHCVQLVPADVEFSVSDEIGGPRSKVNLVKANYSNALDFSLFDWDTTASYPVMQLGSLDDVAVDDAVINPNFALGLTKQLSHGVVSSRVAADGYFLVQADGGPGSSGSAVLSEKTHRVIGIVTDGFTAGGAFVGFGVEPISKIVTFLALPAQPHPVPEDNEDDQ